MFVSDEPRKVDTESLLHVDEKDTTMCVSREKHKVDELISTFVRRQLGGDVVSEI